MATMGRILGTDPSSVGTDPSCGEVKTSVRGGRMPNAGENFPVYVGKQKSRVVNAALFDSLLSRLGFLTLKCQSSDAEEEQKPARRLRNRLRRHLACHVDCVIIN